MAVGVPENDVFAAADAVLARGERPTVERVRLELGRGSPARVGALLDQWWEQLASRLRGEARLPGLPAEVAQAFVAIWQQATVLAQAVVEQSLSAQREVLAAEREALAAQEEHARMQAAQARQQTADALAARQAAETRLADLEQLLTQRLAQIDDMRHQRDALLSDRDEVRLQLGQARQQLQDGRLQAEQVRDEQQRYTRDVEDRAYREIDRAREESKALAVELKASNARVQGLQQAVASNQLLLTEAREQRTAVEAQNLALRDQLDQARQACMETTGQRDGLQQSLQRIESELASAREHAAAAHARAETLSEQLASGNDAGGRNPSRKARKPTPRPR